ncbi:MAG: alpha/beta hydrolase [Candidatus Sericytochromatia bacterium]
MPDAKPIKARLAELWRFRRPFDQVLPDDLDHAHVAPRVGPIWLSQAGSPSALQQKSPVLITVHGFSATPFETHYLLAELLDKHPDWQGARVMLGAHGSAISEFRTASWQDWQSPLEQELSALQRLGYANQTLIATSTGCALLLELLSRRAFPAIQKLVLIAPLVRPREKLVQFVSWARKAGVQAVANDFEPDWIRCWYRELPLHAVEQLHLLCSNLQRILKQGLHLPPELEILIVQSRGDRVVDPESAQILAQALKHNQVEVLWLNSRWHLPILPRKDDPRENAIKDRVFGRIDQFLSQPLPKWP